MKNYAKLQRIEVNEPMVHVKRNFYPWIRLRTLIYLIWLIVRNDYYGIYLTSCLFQCSRAVRIYLRLVRSYTCFDTFVILTVSFFEQIWNSWCLHQIYLINSCLKMSFHSNASTPGQPVISILYFLIIDWLTHR